MLSHCEPPGRFRIAYATRVHTVTLDVRHRAGPDAKVHAVLEQDHVSSTYISASKQMRKTIQCHKYNKPI